MGAWLQLLSTFGFENLLVHGTFALTTAVFWSISLLYLSQDIYCWIPALAKYKTQPGTNLPPDKIKLGFGHHYPRLIMVQSVFRKLISRVTFNWFVINPIFNYCMRPLFIWRHSLYPDRDLRELPSALEIVAEIAVFLLVEEIGFYYTHLALHSPALYARVHKIHHEWSAPLGLTSLYAHPLEHALSNLLPVALGPLLLGSHLVTAWAWYSLSLVSTINAHSGYHLPFFFSPEFHDYHHLKFNQCFGVIGLLDYLHGTDIKFRKSKQFQRNVVLFNSEPLTTTFPE